MTKSHEDRKAESSKNKPIWARLKSMDDESTDITTAVYRHLLTNSYMLHTSTYVCMYMYKSNTDKCSSTNLS